MSATRRVTAGLCLVSLFAASGCAVPSHDDAEDTTVKVGVVLSVTGPAGSLGSSERDTVQAFGDQLSDIGDGTTIEWIVEDDGSDTNRAVSAVNRLISEEGVDAIICCTTSPNSLAVQPAIEPTGVPTVALAAAAGIVEPVSEKELFFKTPFNDRLVLDITAADMRAKGITRVAFLGADDAYGQSGLDAFREAAAEHGLDLVGTETFAPTDTDVTAQITRLRGADPESYLVWGVPPAAAVVQRDLDRLGVDEPIYQGLGVTNQEFLDLSGEAAEGVRIAAGRLLAASSQPPEDELNQRIVEFTEDYEAEVGEPPSPFSGYAYDAMLIVSAAVEQAVIAGVDVGSGDEFRQALRDQIEMTDGVVGVTGIYHISPEDHIGHTEESVMMIEVVDGEFVPASGAGG